MKNSETFRKLDYRVLKQCGLVANDIPAQARQSYINQALMKVFDYLEALDDPFYNFTAPLTVAADQETLWDTVLSGGIITAVNTTAKTITRSSGVFVAGSLVKVAVADTASAARGQWVARITVGGAVGTYVKIGAGTELSLTPDMIVSVTVLKTLSTTTIDLSDMYVKEINRVWDGAAGSERVYHLVEDGRAISDMQNDPDFDATVMAYHRGDTLELKKGTSAGAIGNVQMEYRGKPNEYTDATGDNAILLPPENMTMLFNEVKGMYQLHAKGAMDDTTAKVLAEYAKKYEAAAAEAGKEQEKKGKVSK